jgi:hypothetical protein
MANTRILLRPSWLVDNGLSTPVSFLPGDGTTDDSGFASAPLVSAMKSVPPPIVQVLYLQEAGTTAPISVNDLNQGQIGDCFLISSIGELALTNSAAIGRMIHSNSNGTETVTLYTAQNGSLPTYGTTAFKPVEVTVTNVFPTYAVNNGATQDVAANQKEIWPQVLEKAVATLDGGYGSIANGGSPLIAMEELTGHAATYMSAASLTVAALQKFIAAGDLIVMDTYSKPNLPDNLVSNHAYMLQSLTVTTGGAMLQLRNPWGYDQPSAISLASLSKGITEVDIGSSTHT